MGLKKWVTLPKVGGYCLRPMRTERSGSKEMLRRIAVKQGYYNASSYLFERKKAEPDLVRMEELRTPPIHYGDDQIAYFDEGFALGLDIADIMKQPFGELNCNGGAPMLPVMGHDLERS
jgi:hypothetical protein